jgi:hypothetical protein
MPLDRYWLATAGWFLTLALGLLLCLLVFWPWPLPLRLNRTPEPALFTWWLFIWTEAHVIRTVLCLAHLWWWDWYFAYWPAVWICHLLAVLFLLNAGGISWPRSLMGNFVLALGGLVLIGVLTMTNGAVTWMEGSVSTWIAILAWVMWGKVRSPLISGFVLLYSGGTLTSWWWALRPAPQPAVWLAEFAVQGAAFAWWIWRLTPSSERSQGSSGLRK